ncbi:MAG: lipopolysaccharide kinase InaA family protein [Azoarcus sp.]|nr:lipopolysaccharide kinase InaA family protein [Azoarcus sp.]
MIRIDTPCYRILTADAEIIERDSHGAKVLLLPDESYFKLFRRKRLLSSALWRPYAQRFADACRALAERRIPCPEVIALYRISSIERDAVHYRPLPGQTLRQILKQGIDEADAAQLRRQLGAFVARLHSVGIYFRSLHLGNIMLTPQKTLGLIDLADMRIYRHSLGGILRQRNLKHMLRYPEEAGWLAGSGEFLTAYRANAV